MDVAPQTADAHQEPAPATRPSLAAGVRRGPWPVVAALMAAVCAAAYGLTLAPGVTWANSGLDSGELIAAAVVGGVPHPTGYPTYILLARGAAALRPADPARAVTLLSPVAAALAALALGDLARRWCAAPEPWASAAGLVAGLSLALAPLFWSQAVIAEVYALTALFAAVLLRAALLAALDGPPPPGRAGLTAALAGAGLGAHLTLLPFVLLWLAADARAAGRARRLAWSIFCLGAGLLVYLYLPLAASAAPPISWGEPQTPAGLWWLVSGRLYAGMAFGLPAAELGPRLAAWAVLAPQQLGWGGLALAAAGLAAGGRPCGPWRWAPLGLGALAAAFALGYNSVDAHVYLIPAVMAAALYAGLGAGAILGPVARSRPAAAPFVAVALAAAVLWGAPAAAARVDASGDTRAIRYAAAVLEQAPPGATLLTADDRSTFPLWYYHFARGQRPDLRVVVPPLLEFGWYREGLRATYPALGLPVGSRAELEAALAAAGPVCTASAEQAPSVRCGAP